MNKIQQQFKNALGFRRVIGAHGVNETAQACTEITKSAMKDFAEWAHKQGYVFYENGDGFWVLHADHARENKLTTYQLLDQYLNKDNDG